MAPREGSVGYLWLSETFAEPRWREALVLGTKDGWVQMAVQASASEAQGSGLAHFEMEGVHFCLVEAQACQVRMGPSPEDAPVLSLDVDRKKLLKAGTELMSSEEELVFATASEPPRVRAKPSRPAKKKNEETSSSGSSDEAEAKEEAVLEKLKKKWLGESTEKGSKEKDERKSRADRKDFKSRRFALVSKSKDRRQSDDDLNLEPSDLLKAVSSSKDPLQGLLALQIAQNLTKQKKKKKGKKHRRRGRTSNGSSTSSSRSTSSSSSTSSSGSRTKGHARAVENMEANRKKMFKHPLRYVRRYLKNIEKELGAQDRSFRVIDYTRRISFGKQRNLQKCHHLFGIVLELLLKEEYEKAALQCALNLQALHQAALDGDWTIAWLLTQTPDPYEKRQWGEMQRASNT